MNARRAFSSYMLLLIGFALLSGCDKDDTIQRYQVAKTSDTPTTPDSAASTADSPAPAADMPSTPMPAAAEAQAPIHWIVPATWKQLPGKEMRYASFAVSPDHPDLELTVVPLGGTGGSLLDNINRWEGQIGLPPSSDEDLKKLVTRIDVAGTPVDLFDRTGAQPADHTVPKRILAAIAAHGDRTWFLKLAGPSDLLQAQAANFQSFVRSIRFEAPDAQAPNGASLDASTAAPPIANPVGDGGTASIPITFAVPPGWQQEPARASSFRVAAFTVANGADAGEAVVTHVAANSGTMIDNINRWRGQVGLNPITDPNQEPSEKLAIGDRQATVWDYNNAAGGQRMIVAMITHGDQWWFFKLTGSPALVGDQKSAFNQFVTSVQFRGAAGE